MQPDCAGTARAALDSRGTGTAVSAAAALLTLRVVRPDSFMTYRHTTGDRCARDRLERPRARRAGYTDHVAAAPASIDGALERRRTLRGLSPFGGTRGGGRRRR
jgi:hypothetical protein